MEGRPTDNVILPISSLPSKGACPFAHVLSWTEIPVFSPLSGHVVMVLFAISASRSRVLHYNGCSYFVIEKAVSGTAVRACMHWLCRGHGS